MKQSFKLFNFYGVPVNLKIWFLLLFAMTSPMFVLTIFISVLIHELAHAYVAIKLGYDVSEIYIDIFNGAAMMDINNINDRDSVRIISAGPLSNVILYLLSLTFIYIFGSNDFLQKMVIVNFILFVFNILPIYPMDGGRLLRSYLTIFTKNKDKSIRISAIVSLVLSILLLIYSITILSFFTILFSCLFIYLALKDLNK
jgi:stage IV sporulation protein FB